MVGERAYNQPEDAIELERKQETVLLTMRSFAKESPEVFPVVGGFCKKLLFQSKCTAWL